MSHVRSSAPQGSGGGGGGGSRDAAAPPVDRLKAVQVEQLQGYKHCQFILKPRPVEPPQQQHVPAGESARPPATLLQRCMRSRVSSALTSDFSQKPFKRRRSLITWAFWRGSSSQLNELSLAGAARGCLFGQPLSSICLEDSLPKPIMVSVQDKIHVKTNQRMRADLTSHGHLFANWPF